MPDFDEIAARAKSENEAAIVRDRTERDVERTKRKAFVDRAVNDLRANVEPLIVQAQHSLSAIGVYSTVEPFYDVYNFSGNRLPEIKFFCHLPPQGPPGYVRRTSATTFCSNGDTVEVYIGENPYSEPKLLIGRSEGKSCGQIVGRAVEKLLEAHYAALRSGRP